MAIANQGITVRPVSGVFLGINCSIGVLKFQWEENVYSISSSE